MISPQHPPLEGIGVLVTRPAQQAESLCALIADAGGRTVRFPALAIAAVADERVPRAVLERLDRYDLAIFISPNAVMQGLPLLSGRDWPVTVQRAAVGVGTARALAAHDLPAQIVPAQRFDSEGLLALPGLQAVAGQRIVIVRGEGGRELLADTLRARGAQVDLAEVYRRVKPDADAAPLVTEWARGAIDVVTATSPDTLRNLVEMLGAQGRTLLLRTPLVVVSARMVQLARELGFDREPRLAEGAGDAALLAALCAWRRDMTTGKAE